MNKIISFLLIIFTFSVFAFSQPVLAADSGAAIFSANCAACHIGGKNAVNPAKTLLKEDLEKYEMYDLDKIKTQITNGKMAMPSFNGRLSAEQIDAVANYVLAQADQGW